MSPRTLDDLLILVPGLTRKRSLNADFLRILLDRQPRECTWCGGDVGKRRTWCSDDCVTAFHLRCSSQHQMNHVLKRDGGICRDCGIDTVASEREFKTAWALVQNDYGYSYSQYSKPMLAMKEQFGYGRGRWREVDHLIPVVLGGGLCSVDNLRLLCGQCHARETASLARKRSTKGVEA